MFQEQRDQHSAQWVALVVISSKLGCALGTLRKWGKQAETT